MPITAVLSTSVCPSGLVGGTVIFSNGVRRTIGLRARLFQSARLR
jgi:hypothetical protein